MILDLRVCTPELVRIGVRSTQEEEEEAKSRPLGIMTGVSISSLRVSISQFSMNADVLANADCCHQKSMLSCSKFCLFGLYSLERCDAESEMTWLQVLKLQRTATWREVKAAYKRLALSLHPDKQRGATADQAAAVASQFQQVAEAYDVLTHDVVRDAYDKVRDYMVRLALMIWSAA